MRLSIVGGRDFNDYALLANTIFNSLCPLDFITEIISGGAKGADTLGANFAENNDIPLKVFPAEWDKYGKSAGFIRNQQIVNACDIVLVFWDGISKGTADTISKAKIAKVPTFIVYYDKPKPIIPKTKMKGL